MVIVLLAFVRMGGTGSLMPDLNNITANEIVCKLFLTVPQYGGFKAALLCIDTGYRCCQRCSVGGYNVAALAERAIAASCHCADGVRVWATRHDNDIGRAGNGMLLVIQDEPLGLLLDAFTIADTLRLHEVAFGFPREAHGCFRWPMIGIEVRFRCIHLPRSAERILLVRHAWLPDAESRGKGGGES